MRFLVDECTGTSVLACLRDAGHNAVAVADVIPEADDEDVLDYAITEDRIVVTNDKGFGEMVFHSGRVHRGVLLLRLRDERTENRVRVMKAVLAQVGEKLQGRFTVATEAGIRVRM